MHFDRKTLAVLQHIRRKRDNGASWDSLREKFGRESASIFLLENLSKEGYTITKNDAGIWLSPGDWPTSLNGQFRSYSTAKGNELVEKRLFDFWKWIIPTLISVTALVISALSLLRK